MNDIMDHAQRKAFYKKTVDTVNIKNDITKHKWSDINIDEVTINNDEIFLNSEGEYCQGETIILNKDDAIAIANHFAKPMNDKERLVFVEAIFSPGIAWELYQEKGA